MASPRIHKNRLYNLPYDVWVYLFLIISITTVYIKGADHGFIDVYDDKQYITENNHVQSGLTLEGLIWAFTATYASNWHPLTWISHMLDCQLFGMNPGGHHLTNVFFHIFNALLLFSVFNKMTGHTWRSAFVAGLFALHPLHVESVAWIAERKDVLSAFFWMLTLWAYAWYLDRPGRKRYLVMLLSFVLGLAAKPMLVSLPFVLLLLDYWPLERLRIAPKEAENVTRKWPLAGYLVWEKIPLFALAAASGVITLIAQKSGGAVGSLEEFPILARTANALISYVTYLGKTFWPQYLAVFYPYPKMFPSWHVLGALLLLLLISFLAINTRAKRPYLIVGWLWYMGTLVPVIGLIQVGDQAMADRYTYIPLIGIFVALTWGISELSMSRTRIMAWVLRSIGAIALLILMALTWLQVDHWKNSTTLFLHALDVTTNNYMAHNNLGFAFDNLGNKKEAFDHWSKAVQIKPDFPEGHYNLATLLQGQGDIKGAVHHYEEALRARRAFPQAHHNIARAFEGLGEIKEAIHHYSEVLRIDPGNVEARNDLGLALERQGNLEEAIIHYTEALRIKSDHAAAHNNLGNALIKQGKLSEAIAHYYAALRIKPAFPEVHHNLGLALVQQGNFNEAVRHYSEALRIMPDYAGAHYSLGKLLASQGHLKEAISHFSAAVRTDPDHAQAHFSLANELCEQGDLSAAIQHYSEAIRIIPDFAQAHYNLGNTLYRRGNSAAAITHYSEAVQAKPDYTQALYNLGIALEGRGDLHQAIKNFSAALKVSPNFTKAKDKVEQLSRLLERTAKPFTQ